MTDHTEALKTAIAAAVDAYRADHPGLTVGETMAALNGVKAPVSRLITEAELRSFLLEANADPDSEIRVLGELIDRICAVLAVPYESDQRASIGIAMLRAFWWGEGQPLDEVTRPFFGEDEKVVALRSAQKVAAASNVKDVAFMTRLDVPPDRVLGKAFEKRLASAVILGWQRDGEFWFSSSIASGPDLLWLLRMAEKRLLDISDELADQNPFLTG